MMTPTTVMLFVLSILADVALAATKTKAKTSTRTGVSKTTVTKYKKKKGKAVPWNQLSKGAKIAVYIVCAIAGLILLVVLVLVLRKKLSNKPLNDDKDQEAATSSEETTPYEKPQNGENSWAIPPPGQGEAASYFHPTVQPVSYGAPAVPPPSFSPQTRES